MLRCILISVFNTIQLLSFVCGDVFIILSGFHYVVKQHNSFIHEVLDTSNLPVPHHY